MPVHSTVIVDRKARAMGQFAGRLSVRASMVLTTTTSLKSTLAPSAIPVILLHILGVMRLGQWEIFVGLDAGSFPS